MSSSRGRLVQRSRIHQNSTPARGRGRDSEAPTHPQHELPPYEPPSCPLSESAKRKLDELRASRDAVKYNKHLKAAIDAIPNAAAACNDRLSSRRAIVDKRANKRKHDGVEDSDMPPEHKEAETYLRQLEKNVIALTEKSEKALRELIDLADEATMQDSILKEVEESIPAPAARPARRQRIDDEDEEDENETPAEDAEILSAVELIKKAKADYKAAYQSKSMMQRYGDSNDYKNYKRILHDAQNHGDDVPPLPRASTWFPDEDNSPASRRRRNNTTDHINNGDEDSDDEIIIESATTNLKCCLTLKYFNEPYSSNICPHTFEKSAIREYGDNYGTVYNGPNSDGKKRFKCPQTGCDKMLTTDDFFDDALMLRKVKRAQKAAAREDEDDDEAEDTGPRGTQRNRPEKIGSEDDDEMDEDEDETRNKRMEKFKREKSRGLSVTPSRRGRADDVEVMDMA